MVNYEIYLAIILQLINHSLTFITQTNTEDRMFGNEEGSIQELITKVKLSLRETERLMKDLEHKLRNKDHIKKMSQQLNYHKHQSTFTYKDLDRLTFQDSDIDSFAASNNHPHKGKSHHDHNHRIGHQHAHNMHHAHTSKIDNTHKQHNKHAYSQAAHHIQEKNKKH